MIKGIGIDIVELARIESIVKRNERFIDRLLTDAEKKAYKTLENDHRKMEFLAGRFAAKEAFAKAIGTGIGKVGFLDIHVLPDQHGAPRLAANGYEGHKIFVSITHSRDYAVAQVVLEE